MFDHKHISSQMFLHVFLCPPMSLAWFTLFLTFNIFLSITPIKHLNFYFFLDIFKLLKLHFMVLHSISLRGEQKYLHKRRLSIVYFLGHTIMGQSDTMCIRSTTPYYFTFSITQHLDKSTINIIGFVI